MRAPGTGAPASSMTRPAKAASGSRRITTGFGSEPVAQCRSVAPISMTSAFSLSRSTVARRTVQTLIGS